MSVKQPNTLYGGIDLHSRTGTYAITDARDTILFKKKLPNHLPTILDAVLSLCQSHAYVQR